MTIYFIFQILKIDQVQKFKFQCLPKELINKLLILYELYEDKCIKICPESCLECKVEDYQNICVKCPLGLRGRNRSLIDNQCIECPYNCQLCQQRTEEDIFAVNPLFNNSEFSYFSYFCISGFKGYLDQELGLYVDCQYEACQQQIIINLNLLCNPEEYQRQFDLLYDENQKIKFKQENILGDHLFSSSSFPEFETQEFYQMANQKSIKQILIKITSQQKQTCLVNDQLQISQKFSSNIFSTIDVQLEIFGQGITTFYFQKQLLFLNFKRVYIQGIQLQIEYFIFGPNLLKFASPFEQTIELVDITYSQEFEQTTFYIIMQNSKNVLIQDFLLINYTKQFTIDAFIKIEQIQSLQKIKIHNFSVFSSSFLDTHLFWFDLKEQDKVDMQLIYIEKTFFNQSLIYQTKGQLQIQYIKVQSCQIQSQSALFQINSLKHFELNFLDFISNIIESGNILKLNQNTNLLNLNITKNQFYKKSQFIYNENIEIQYLFIQNIVFQLNIHNEYVTFLKLTSTLVPNKEIIIDQFSIIGNKFQQIDDQAILDHLNITLIYMEVQIITIDQLIIEKSFGLPVFVISNANQLQLNQITIQQHDNYKIKGLYQNYDCFQNSIKNITDQVSIKIYNVPIIELKQITISKAQSINNPIIEIKTSILNTQTKKQILLSEMNFNQNLLLTTNKINLASLFKISSEEDYQIDIKNSNFERNVMHQYTYIDQINSGLVFFIDCNQCTLFFQSLIFQRNIVTNSSNSIILIQTKSLEIIDCSFNENSQFDYLILQPYLFWGYQENQEIFMEQLESNFPIVVKTGNGRIQSQHLMIKNITISNSTGSAFYIYLEKEASLNIQNAIISYINALFLNEDEDGGSFMIDTSITVSAQMNFNNISINDIYFRNKGGFIYIQNVLETTTIQLSNIFSNDVYSLKGSILYVEFAFYSKQQQQLTLDNIKTIDTQQGFLRFLSKFTKINSQILSELKFKRSLFQISYAQQIRITNLLILSLLHQSLAIISESKIILIQNCKVSNSNIQNSLLSFSQMQTDSKISLIDFQVTNTSMLQHIPTTNYCIIDSSNFEIQQQNCEKEYIFKEAPIQLIQKYIHDDISNSYCIINQMNQLQTQSVSSLIDINPQATQSQISRLTLREINCKICKYGLFNVNFENNYSIVIMNQITIQDNQCGQQSCLNFIKFISNSRVLQSLEQNIQEKTFELKLHNFKCIGNLAYKGTCLQIQNLKTLIENSILQNNTAESFGGSIYVIGKESFFVLNTVIQFNQAQFGGGLFLKDQIIQNLNKQGTSVNDNIGISFGKDLAQLPSQLSISTDLQNLLPKIKIQENDNILIEQIQIEKYQTVLNTYSDVLYVPNGQILSNYQFFDLKKQQYFPYNIHLRLIPLDLQNNIQKNLDNTQCKVSGRILTQNEDEQFNNDYTSFNSITFNQSDYNFDQLIFYLDDQLNQTLQLQFHCNSIFTPIYGKNKEIIGYHNNYYLRMNIKSLPCQLGEIKSLYDATCQPCDTTLGLYSLNLNSHNCSQKDDISTSEIKSAQLRLRPGFWRPYYNTDFISQCINLLSNCNGGWIEGDTSCFEGHIGALCEECDIQNSQGYGHFSISSKYSCGLCVQNNQNIAALTFISLWTLISILISVRSNVTLNDQILLKKVISKLFLTNIQYHSNFGILIKITTHHLQIVSFVFTFRITNIIGVGKVINSISNPIQTITHSLDCVLKDMFDIEIHYSRIIWHLIMPFIYIVLFLILYWIALKINRLQYSSTVIITTLIFMYIYLQPFLVGGLISLMSYRQISGFNWIQANVAFRYDTPPHQKWLYSFCLPLLILITSIIPFIFFICLYLNKTTLHKKITRQKLGYLYNEYKLEAYYWEIIKILFKELMIIFLSYYDENVVKKGILLLSLVYIYWELSKIFKPYVSFILNKLDAYSANVCGISIALGIGIYIDQENQSYEIQILYLLILFTLNLQYLIKILKEILFSFADENFLFLDKIKSIIKNKIPSILKYQIFQKLLQNRNAQKQRIDQRYLKLRKYLIGQAKIIIQCKKNYGIKITSNSFNKSSLNL